MSEQDTKNDPRKYVTYGIPGCSCTLATVALVFVFFCLLHVVGVM